MSEYRIIEGDCLTRLREMDEQSVQTCVTSPPYWGLRDYGNEGQLGLEPTPEEYVTNMVEVFREVKRVLRDDGTLWLNLGDSYASGGSGPTGDASTLTGNGHIGGGPQRKAIAAVTRRAPDLKPKDLVGIPWMVAFALRADGWYLRSDIIWAKPNPMPESVTDRPTKAHEYLFLLTKSPRYFYDADAIREQHGSDWLATRKPYDLKAWNGDRGDGGQPHQSANEAGRNKRSVWTVTTQPFPGAHFATFPPKLIEPCILAGSPPKCCGICAAPWERVVERTGVVLKEPKVPITERRGDAVNDKRTTLSGTQVSPASVKTLGWQPTCDHDEASGVYESSTAASTVLDPFNGAGTTGVVALRHDRDYIGIELNPEYAQMARDRIYDDAPLLNMEAV